MGLRVNEFDNELMELGFVEITNVNVGPAQSAADKMCTDDWNKGIPTLESQIFHNENSKSQHDNSQARFETGFQDRPPEQDGSSEPENIQM
ncbi:hypothetical protein DTO212C5_6204 [Paecilomyces variotii]|nr:hypothetical protein DTO212C5_6204 [Paecilomyces variotii]